METGSLSTVRIPGTEPKLSGVVAPLLLSGRNDADGNKRGVR